MNGEDVYRGKKGMYTDERWGCIQMKEKYVLKCKEAMCSKEDRSGVRENEWDDNRKALVIRSREEVVE